jgi:MFS family permease
MPAGTARGDDAERVAGRAAELAPAPWQSHPEVVRGQRRLLAVLVVSQLLGALGMGAVPSVGVLLAEEVAGSELLAGIARTGTTVGAALVALPLATLAARRGRRVALTTGWGGALLGSALLVVAGVADSVPLLVLGLLLTGFGTALMLQNRFAAIDLALPERRTRTLSFVVWTGTFGAVLGPNLGAPGTPVAGALGIPVLAGAFVLATACLLAAMLVVLLALRPDPLELARRHAPSPAAPPGTPAAPVRDGRVRRALGAIRRSPDALFAVVALLAAHGTMVAVMTMTPVHLHHHGATLTVVGLTISGHVVGMFAFAPLVGAAADAWGARRTVLAAQGLFLVTAALGVLGARSPAVVAVALFLLGLSWSIATVPASSLLSSAIAAADRVEVQGVSDALMNVVAAAAALLAGPALVLLGFEGLSVLAALFVLPVLVIARRERRTPTTS